SAQVRTDSVFTHRLFRDLTRGQSGALGPRERGGRANRVTRGLVTERCSTVSWCRSKGDLGEQRPARAKRVRQGGGGHQDGFENERKGNADALDFSLIAQVAMTGANVGMSPRSTWSAFQREGVRMRRLLRIDLSSSSSPRCSRT